MCIHMRSERIGECAIQRMCNLPNSMVADQRIMRVLVSDRNGKEWNDLRDPGNSHVSVLYEREQRANLLLELRLSKYGNNCHQSVIVRAILSGPVIKYYRYVCTLHRIVLE
jgi:hypothetical protein